MNAEQLAEAEFLTEVSAIVAALSETLVYLDLGLRRRLAVAEKRPARRGRASASGGSLQLTLVKGGDDER